MLQCVICYFDIFDVGFCVFGISELEGFDKFIYKFEMDYLVIFVFYKGMLEEDKVEVYRDRSVLYYVDKVKMLLVFYYLRDDIVVFIFQVEIMFEVLKDKVDVKIIKVLGDGYLFVKFVSQKVWISEVEVWWRSYLF